MAPPILGIDLGTNFISASVYRNDNVERIPNRYGNYQTPSYVAFTEKLGRLVGEDAKEHATINPKNTIYAINFMVSNWQNAKRLIGQKWEHVAAIKASYPFTLVQHEEYSKIQLEIDNETALYSPVEILSIMLETVKQDAEKYLGEAVKDAVITVPAHFRYFQRHLTGEAANLAGLNVEIIISEPEAVALACAYQTPGSIQDQERQVMIVDIGGSGLNACVATIDNGQVDIHAIVGVSWSGGQAMVNRMLAHLAEEFKKAHQKDLSVDQRALARLRVACEKAMVKLSICTEALVQIDQLFEGIDFCTSISRPMLECLADDLLRGNLEPLDFCLKNAKMDKGDIDKIVVIGRCLKIPQMRKLLIQHFEGQEVGFEENGLTPGEGAAILAGILGRQFMSKDLLLYAVNPYSLGIKTSPTDSTMITISRRNNTIPNKMIRSVDMPVDENVPNSVSVEIYEGEGAMVENNNFLGKVTLKDLRLKRNVDGGSLVKLEIAFDVDARNELKVTVVHEKTGDCTTFNVSAELALLRRREMEVMKTNAKKFREKTKLKERVNPREWEWAKGELAYTCSKIEMALSKDLKGKLSGEEIDAIFKMVGDVRYWINRYGSSIEKLLLEQKLEEVKAFCRAKNAGFLLNP